MYDRSMIEYIKNAMLPIFVRTSEISHNRRDELKELI
jgi:hypothetical protein